MSAIRPDFAGIGATAFPAEPTAPLLVVEQQRAALVTRLANQWPDAFAVLPRERRLCHEQVSSALWVLRADRLFAVTLAGEVEAIEVVLGEVSHVQRPRQVTSTSDHYMWPLTGTTATAVVLPAVIAPPLRMQ